MPSNGPCQRVGCCRESVVYRKPIGGNTILGFCGRHDPRDDPAVREFWQPGLFEPNDRLPETEAAP